MKMKHSYNLFSRARNQRGRAFTLIELLVVVAVIAILAAMIIPAVATAREKGRQTHCKNNMRQFATLLMIYRDDHEKLNPGWLSNLGAPKDMFVCKTDSSQGAWGSKPDDAPVSLIGNQFPKTDDTDSNNTVRLPLGANAGITRCSYMYEFSAAELSSVDGVDGWGWPGYLNATVNDVDMNADGIASWGEVKEYQLRHGDLSHTNALGDPTAYDETGFPIIRCYNHYKTRAITVLNTDVTPNQPIAGNLTINCAYGGNVFESGLKWEYPVVK